jgi:superfamily I DNA and/or RNA helicase/very-short-patch-repair endonuclease
MSPLAVSQYLELEPEAPNPVGFDTVIFDEASQVFPEDAVPAIMRARQVILAGDQKQLPPSNFWRSSIDQDADDDDDVPDSLQGMESILDAAVADRNVLFDEAHLTVHYRSRDERLIRFSNHTFYRDRPLLTFPAPGGNPDELGVRDVFVPEGRYDAGSTRVNRREAERVVELVFEHMRTRPVLESLGVVAFSRAQADLIQDLIDQKRLTERDVETRFNEGAIEPFFVKNLENAQGDERDHIIISVGYGPLESGGVPNRFGPINREGGERRLNVAITRARNRLTVVHSLLASHVTADTQGPRLLRRFLEYVEDPDRLGFETTVEPGEEPDTPFEDAVRRALEKRGHRVASQVGVSGYRIDLGILSEDGSRFDLGVECDGATYHSAPAARDRDWLRERVLAGLGWSIHRVWSTAWIRNPEAELNRIEEALSRARERGLAS